MLGRMLCLLGMHRWYYKASYGWCQRQCGRHGYIGGPGAASSFQWREFQGEREI